MRLVLHVDATLVLVCMCASLRGRGYWQASQSGLSIEQNLMSLAGSAIAGANDADAADAAEAVGTAFNAPGATVLFSA
jgi:hypothetical protein